MTFDLLTFDSRLLTSMVADRHICEEWVELKVGDDGVNPESSDIISGGMLYFLPEVVGSDEVEAAKEDARGAWHDSLLRRQVCVLWVHREGQF